MMSNPWTDYLLWGLAMVAGFYTLTYAYWLWKKKNLRGALGVVAIAFLTVVYPGIILFFLQR